MTAVHASGRLLTVRFAVNRRERLFWMAYSAVYDLLWDNQLTDRVASEVAGCLPAGAGVLEVGAGTGLITRQLTNRVDPVVACEPNPWMRARLQRRALDATISAEPIERLSPSTDPSSIVAVNVVHLTPDPGATVRQLRSLAGAEGTVVIITPAPHVSLRSVARAQRSLGVPRWRALRFVVLHALMAPLTMSANMAVDPRRLAAVAADAGPRTTIAGVSQLIVLRGGRTDGERPYR